MSFLETGRVYRTILTMERSKNGKKENYRLPLTFRVDKISMYSSDLNDNIHLSNDLVFRDTLGKIDYFAMSEKHLLKYEIFIMFDFEQEEFLPFALNEFSEVDDKRSILKFSKDRLDIQNPPHLESL